MISKHTHTALGQNTKNDAGEGGSGVPFYVTHLEPNDWWKWFLDPHDERLKVKKATGGGEDVSDEDVSDKDADDKAIPLDKPDKKQDEDRGWTEVYEHYYYVERLHSLVTIHLACRSSLAMTNHTKHLMKRSPALVLNWKDLIAACIKRPEDFQRKMVASILPRNQEASKFNSRFGKF